MPTRLVILGLLRDRPLYGYELKQLIEESMGDWTNIAFGSIYYALDRLAADGFVERMATEQEGSRPSRTVYQITASGRQEFERLLQETWSEVEHPYYAFDVGLAFMHALPAHQLRELLLERVHHLEHALAYLDAHQADETAREHGPIHLIRAVFDHHRVHRQAELDWTHKLLSSVERGDFEQEIAASRAMEWNKPPKG